jgi:hypothetical protein
MSLVTKTMMMMMMMMMMMKPRFVVLCALPSSCLVRILCPGDFRPPTMMQDLLHKSIELLKSNQTPVDLQSPWPGIKPVYRKRARLCGAGCHSRWAKPSSCQGQKQGQIMGSGAPKVGERQVCDKSIDGMQGDAGCKPGLVVVWCDAGGELWDGLAALGNTWQR